MRREDAPISAVESTPIEYPTAPPQALALEPAPADILGALPPLTAPETAATRWTFFGVAIAVTVLFFVGVMTFWVPVHPGVDQNGYLFGGRQLAQTGTMKFAPADPIAKAFDPHQFVGRMWVGADYGLSSERFYPKYPIGLPLLVAVALKLGGPEWGPWLTYLINPIAMSLAVLGSFLLLRTFVSSFLAVLGQIIFATSPVTMLLSIDSNSHATAVFCVTWGMVGLFAWWKRGHPMVAFAAGLLTGYAITIRYTEATLLLPLVLVIAFRLGLGSKWWRIPSSAAKLSYAWAFSRGEDVQKHQAILRSLTAPLRDWLGAGLMVLGWLIPVGGLLLYNFAAMGTPTGYDPTNESKPGQSFTLDHAIDNWETTLRHLAVNGLFFLFPVAVMGLAWMFAWRRRAALVVAAWIVPCLLAYTLYYWAPDPQSGNDWRSGGNLGVNISYLRFFLTVLPGLALCGIWAMGHLTGLVAATAHTWTRRVAALSVVPLVATVAAAVHVHNNGRDMETNQYGRLVLQTNVEQILEVIPEGSAIFFNEHGLLHHLQFARNYLLFDTQTYRKNVVDGLLNNVDPDDPQGLDPGRSKSMYDRLKDFDQKQLDERLRQSALGCLESGRRVFVLESPSLRRIEQAPPAKTNRPRPLNDVVRRITTKADGTPLYADVIARWRRVLIPKSVSEQQRDGKRNVPRQRSNRTIGQTYDQPWLIYEVTKKPFETVSAERQAIADYEAEQKAKADTVAAERQATERARQEAQAKQREADRQRQENERQAREKVAAQLREQQATLKDLQGKVATARTTLEKSSTDLATTRSQLDEAKKQFAAVNDSIRRANADRQTIESTISRQNDNSRMLGEAVERQRQEQAVAEKKLTELRAQMAAEEKKLAAARVELERLQAEQERLKNLPATRPATQSTTGPAKP